MGKYLKIEWLAIIMILIMLGVSYLIKVENDKAKNKNSAKEFEVFDSVTVEINATDVKSILYSDYTVQKNGNMQMIWPDYSGKTAKKLRSKFGRSIGDKFYLDMNVTMLQDNGYYYEADHAVYDKKSDIFYTTSPFVAYVHGGNIIHGINLKYHIKEKITTAENVDAVFYTDD